MSEHDDSKKPTPRAAPGRWPSRRGWVIAGAVIGATMLLAGAKTLVFAHDNGWRHGPGAMGADRFADHIEHHVKHVLSDVDATAEQEAQITSILKAAALDVHALADEHHAAHERLHELLIAPAIDRAQLETLRADQMRLADDASKRIVQGIADAAEVLSPEQRTTLAADLQRHRHWRKD